MGSLLYRSYKRGGPGKEMDPVAMSCAKALVSNQAESAAASLSERSMTTDRLPPGAGIPRARTATSLATSTALHRFDVGASPWDARTFQVLASQSSGTMSLYEISVVALHPG